MRTLNNASKHARYRKVVVRGQLCLIIRQSALKQKQKNIEGLFSFVTTYHPVVQDLKKTLMANRSQIENRPLLKTIFKRPLIISYKRGKYLKAKLVTWRQLPDNASGGSRGGAWGAAPLSFLDQNEARRAEKKIFEAAPPPLISGCGGVYLPLRPGAILSVTTEFGDHHDKSASNWGHNTVEPRYNECQGTDNIWFAITRFRYTRVYNGLLVRSKSFFIYFTITGQCRIQGRGLGGPGPPPLFLDQTATSGKGKIVRWTEVPHSKGRFTIFWMLPVKTKTIQDLNDRAASDDASADTWCQLGVMTKPLHE